MSLLTLTAGLPLATAPLLADAGAFKHPAIETLFDGRQWGARPEDGFFVKQEDPRNGFDPYEISLGHLGRIQVLWVDDPKAAFPGELGQKLAAQWDNSIGMIVARSLELGALFAYTVHSVQKNHWSHYVADVVRDWVWGVLGGTMARGATYPLEDGLSDDVIKAGLMQPKWMRIARQHQEIGHPFRPELAGGKGILWADDQALGLLLGGLVYNSVGVQTGSDEGLTAAGCLTLARLAPRAFMGVTGHPNRPYAGLTEPSPWTAAGVFAGMRAGQELLLDGRPMRVLLQGYGNVGQPLSELIIEHQGGQVVAVVDIDLGTLHKASEAGYRPLFDREAALRIVGQEKAAKLERAARRNDWTIVNGLADAITEVGDSVNILSVNAGAKVIGPAEILALQDSSIKMIAGAANGPLKPVNGSVALPAWALRRAGIFNAADFAFNLGGADSVLHGVKTDYGDEEHKRFTAQVGAHARRTIREDELRDGVPSQLAETNREQTAWRELVAAGEAIGGDSPVQTLVAPDEATLQRYLAGAT